MIVIVRQRGFPVREERPARFEELGVLFGSRRWQDLVAIRKAGPEVVVDPDKLHDELYRAEPGSRQQCGNFPCRYR